jgi:hypothetical protein
MGMKGIITAALLAAGGLSLLGTTGCAVYRDWVDPCYPERYNHQAREEFFGAINPQVQNGHILDQTVWAYDFEPGTDRLTGAGLDKLVYITRGRPTPDCLVFLQTAQLTRDLAYDPAAPERLAAARVKLDNERITAIQRFLNAQTEGRPMSFQVVIHDPGPVDLASQPVLKSVISMYGSAMGTMAAPAK